MCYYTVQAKTYKENFHAERTHREAIKTELDNTKDQSTISIHRLEARVIEFERERNLAPDQCRRELRKLKEEYKAAQEQLKAFNIIGITTRTTLKQEILAYKQELDEERKKVEQMQASVNALNVQLSLQSAEVSVSLCIL